MQVIYQAAAKNKANFYSVSLYHLPAGGQNFVHYHDVLELGVCLEGAGQYLTPNAATAYKKGDVQCIRPLSPHYNVTKQENTLWFFINIDLSRLSAPGVTVDPIYINTLLQKIPCDGIFKGNTPAAEAIKEIASLLQSESQDQALLVIKIVLLLKMLGSDTVSDSTHAKDKRLLPSLHLVSALVKDGQQPTPKAMADACFMSESYFRKKFIAYMGESPKSYITRIQMQQATTLLMDRQAPVTQIARQCGFGDFSTFYRSFKAVYGVSPNDYRTKFAL